jgi:hypothetical protein
MFRNSEALSRKVFTHRVTHAYDTWAACKNQRCVRRLCKVTKCRVEQRRVGDWRVHLRARDFPARWMVGQDLVEQLGRALQLEEFNWRTIVEDLGEKSVERELSRWIRVKP